MPDGFVPEPDSEEKTAEDLVDPLDALLSNVGPLNLPPIAPDGGFAPVAPLMPEPIPAATPENFVCLRGCRYYMETRMPAALGNTRGTFAQAPMQITRYCNRMPGYVVSLVDEVVSDCSEWHPYTAEELCLREAARSEVRFAHPEWFVGGKS